MIPFKKKFLILFYITMDEKKKILCDFDIENRSDFRKWSKKLHPDKTNDPLKHEQLKKITNIVNDLLPDNNTRINCRSSENKILSSSSSSSSSLSVFKDIEEQSDKYEETSRTLPVDLKKASCFRTVENWSKIQSHHRFDKPSFNKKQFLKDMPIMSPKMTELLNNIRELDENDLKNDKKYYKHFIFSDVKKGGYGAKIIASALSASGFNHCFTPSLKIVKPKTHESNETFGVLSSTSIFDKTFSQKHVKDLLNMYNKRPDNVNGENLRFIVLDSGYKEGIDLFDVKYVHIFENQQNSADLVQAVGRATRSCGQSGLNFQPNKGWPLHVYQYYLTYENEKHSVFNDYIQYKGVDLNLHLFSRNIEKLAIYSAVDRYLNININKFQSKVDDNTMSDTYLLKGSGGSQSYNFNTGCNVSDKCGVRSTKTVPFSIKLMKSIYKSKLPSTFNILSTKEKRDFFCKKLQENYDFCNLVNNAYARSLGLSTNENKQIVLRKNTPNDNNDDIENIVDEEQKKAIQLKRSVRFKNTEDMSYEEFQKYVNKMFKKYKYEPIKIENNCIKKNDSNIDERIVNFTKSQEFVTNYFTPNHFGKGLLVWHSVGTGKTCTAISVKSFLYERMNYSVIWVTRTTLKEDIWKNMYDKICDHIIRQKYDGSQDSKSLKKHLSKRFLPPMSYRQFSNMLEGKNDLYNRLVSLNGTTDILKNTLVIIDEAHKLYSNGLEAAEKPNMNIIENKINESKTCKVLLMTGTPIADDPMEFMKLMNLIIKQNKKLPDSIQKFRTTFMDQNNKFTEKGISDFQNRVKGLISYLNRKFDPRQFAQPVFFKRPVIMSISNNNFDDCLREADQQLNTCIDNISKPDDNKATQLKNNIKQLYDSIIDIKGDLILEPRNKDIKQVIQIKKNELKALKKELASEKKINALAQKQYNKSKIICKKQHTYNKKQCKQQNKLQEHFQNNMLKKC